MNAEEIISQLEDLRARDLPTHGGRTLAYVYDSGIAEADELGRRALAMFGSSNGLDPTAFPSLLHMERDLIDFARPLLHGSDEMAGTVTSGGTESILLAVLAARNAHPQITRPVMVVPSSIHAAFNKAAHYFGVERVSVPVDPTSRKADPAALAQAVNRHGDNVILLAASAPSYAHGVIDPIAEISDIALARRIRFHVDACIGGWVLPWAKNSPPAWDFAVPGVTSISVDLHKYAYTPKGVSLLLHANARLREPQFFASADWPGYTMLNATMQSTKSGGPLAAAWAVVKFIGVRGYDELVESTLTATRALARGIDRLDHVGLLVEPESSIVAMTSDDRCDIFTIADAMRDHGWFVQPQLSFGDEQPSLHFTMCAATAPAVGELLEALEASIAAAVRTGPIEPADDLRSAIQGLDPASLDDEAFMMLLQLAGLGPDSDGQIVAPERMAPINALLNIAPPAAREALLIGFLDRMSR